MTYSLTRKAVEDIIRLYGEGVRLFGVDQAERYHAGLETAFGLLSDNPMLARERPEIDPPVRIHPYGSHIIIYRIEENGIVVIRIRHGREDWKTEPGV